MEKYCLQSVPQKKENIKKLKELESLFCDFQ